MSKSECRKNEARMIKGHLVRLFGFLSSFGFRHSAFLANVRALGSRFFDTGSSASFGETRLRLHGGNMAGFKTHITTSTVLGIGYGAGAHVLYNVPLPTCALAAGLCSVSLTHSSVGPERYLSMGTGK